ncbi:hypothetical protein GCM10010524_70440 [Streptomyces mexicanus]
MSLPPQDLHALLAPVGLVRARRLDRPAARKLVAAVRSELKAVQGSRAARMR